MKFNILKDNMNIFLAKPSPFLNIKKKGLGKISEKISEIREGRPFRKGVFMFSFSILILPFLLNLAKAEPTRSFPIAETRAPLQKIQVVATAYSSDVWQTDATPCIPADGYDLCEHYEKFGEGNTIAANFLPLGAQVKIPELYGDKIFVVHDRMNSRYGYGRIDIWMPTREEAKQFGVKRFEIEMYGGSRWKISYK